MVVVKVELWPNGNESQAKTIAVANIANDGTGSVARGNYDVSLLHSGRYFGKPGTWKRGRVVGFDRESSPYHLVLAALKSALGLR